ncbi:CYTH domain-containing protein [Frankia sp. R82]|uniref:CYTH domain-containing protein n=1 Tax=Frankia sp. R82 TaxID=2950553 RepID=UPI002044B47D|nr:CYTH domain-containing protein [Frankia sp. R82]MCM3882315.1 CYTH domain-containing protein [Frankia sp. R82]
MSNAPVTAASARPPIRGARAAQQFWQLPERQLTKLLDLAAQVDRLELKLTVPAHAHEAARDALDLTFPRTPTHRVYYLDTPDRALHRRGMILRVRRGSGGTDDSVVKLRPVVPQGLPPRLRQRRDFVVEVDGMPGGYVCSGALKSRLDAKVAKGAVNGRRSLRALFTGPQLRLLRTHVKGKFDVEDLMVLGPVQAYRRTLDLTGHPGLLLAERWVFPDGSEILELSTRCAPRAALRAAASTAAVLGHHGIDLGGPQRTKTRVTLEYFTGQLATGAAGGAQRARRDRLRRGAGGPPRR